MFIDSFSSDIAELKKGERTPENALRCLKQSPCVSAFDMSENHTWLSGLIEQLKADGSIMDAGGEYPWCKYTITGKENS